jgi:hypothetical protein
MANTLRIKRRASGGASGAPTTSQCVNAELAFNEVDGILYYGKGGDGTASSSVVAIGAELGTGVAAFLKSPSSANLISAVSDETGSGSLVFGTGPSLQLPIFSTENISASGDTRGSFPITKDVAQVVLAGAVTLPAVATGKRVTVMNMTASAINVYPATGETVNAIMGNGPYSLAATSAMTFYGVTSFGSGLLRWQTQSTSLDAVSSLGTNVATFLQTPTSANLYAALTDEIGSTGGSPLVMFNVNPTVQQALKVSAGNVLYSKLAQNGVSVYNFSDDSVAASLVYTNVGQYLPTSGWITKGNLVFSDSYGATSSTALKWQVSSAVAGESAVFATLSSPTIPATYAAHPDNVSGSGYGKISYDLKLPANSGELATTTYVASAIAAATGTSTSLKQAVAVATTANITLSGLQTIDGYTTVAGDRVLVKNQTTGSANGIYVAVAGSWTRATDVDTAGEIGGASVFVQNGTTNGSKTFTCTTANITLGTTALTFTDTATIAITAGNGLTLTGSTLDIGTASSSRIVVNSDNIDLASGVATAGTYRSVTVDTYGRVTAGTTPTTFTGYGISDSADNLRSAITSTTGTGDLVFATSPTFTTPTIGVATATSVNKVAITTPATSATLTIADGKTLTASNTLTFTGTDSSSVAFGGGGTVVYTANKLSVHAATTSSELAGVISDETGTGSLVFGTAPAFTTSVDMAPIQTTFEVFNNVSANTISAFGRPSTVNIAHLHVGTQTVNIATGVTGAALTKTVNIGTSGAAVSTTNINIGSSTPGATSTTTINGNFTVTGSTTIVNATTLQVSDKIIEVATPYAVTGLQAILTGSVTSVTLTSGSTAGLIVGQALTKTDGSGAFNAAGVTIATITSATTFTVSAGHATGGAITFSVSGTATDTTADGGGVTVKGATDKTLNWVNSTSAWTSSEHFNLASGKAFYIAGTSVLSGTTLGSGVTGSSLTSVGTIGTGTWQGTAVTTGYGGTGLTSYTAGDLLYYSSGTTLSKLAKPAATSILQMTSAGTPSWVDPCTAIGSCTLDGGTF